MQFSAANATKNFQTAFCNSRSILQKFFKRKCCGHDAPLSVILTAVLIGILALAILGLGWQTFFSGVARGAQQAVDNPVVD
jgi:hypothetical protein